MTTPQTPPAAAGLERCPLCGSAMTAETHLVSHVVGRDTREVMPPEDQRCSNHACELPVKLWEKLRHQAGAAGEGRDTADRIIGQLCQVAMRRGWKVDDPTSPPLAEFVESALTAAEQARDAALAQVAAMREAMEKAYATCNSCLVPAMGKLTKAERALCNTSVVLCEALASSTGSDLLAERDRLRTALEWALSMMGNDKGSWGWKDHKDFDERLASARALASPLPPAPAEEERP